MFIYYINIILLSAAAIRSAAFACRLHTELLIASNSDSDLESDSGTETEPGCNPRLTNNMEILLSALK